MLNPLKIYKKWRDYQRQMAEITKQNALNAEKERIKGEKEERYKRYSSNYTWLSEAERHGLQRPQDAKDIEEFVDSPYFLASEKEVRTVSTENWIIHRFEKNENITVRYKIIGSGGVQLDFNFNSIRSGFEFPALALMILNNSAQLRDLKKDGAETCRKDASQYGFLMCNLLATAGGTLSDYYDGVIQDSPGAYTFDYHRFTIRFKETAPKFLEDGLAMSTKEFVLEEVDLFMKRWPTDRITRKFKAYMAKWPP